MSPDEADERVVRQTISAFDSLTEAERRRFLPWIASAIARQDIRTQDDLERLLEEKLTQASYRSEVREPEDSLPDLPAAAATQASFNALVERMERSTLPEPELRRAIADLALDPDIPEVGLTWAMELAGMIDRMEDTTQQTMLRQLLEDRLETLQVSLE